jgi:hypothetical protein
MVMKQYVGRLALVCAVTIAGAGQTRPAALSPADELAKLRAENDRLREEVEALRAQVAAGGRPVAAQPAASQPATTRPVVRTFTTMQDILARAPGELKPQARSEWHTFTKGKFETWWQDQLTGMKFDQTLSLTCQVTRSIAPRPGAEYTVRGGFAKKEFVAFSETQKWALTDFQYDVDEAAAKKWMAVKAGTNVRVRGTIGKVSFNNIVAGNRFPQYTVTLTLVDLDIVLP